MTDNNTDMKDHDLLISLNAKIDSMIEKIEKLDAFETRIRNMEVSDGVNKSNIETMGKEVEKLRSTNNIWNTILTLLTTIAIALGISPN